MNSKLKSGDLLHRSKGIVEHAGVYLGNGMVVHNEPNNGVNITTYADYANGREVKVTCTSIDDIPLIATRLREITGNDSQYQLWANNCEHIAQYLIHGAKVSPQVQASIVGAGIGALIASQSKSPYRLLWIIGCSLAGLAISNSARKYDYIVSPIPA